MRCRLFTTVSALLLLPCAATILFCVRSYINPAHRSGQVNTRLVQLYESNTLLGKGRKEILEILGKPNQPDLNAESLHYRIRPERAYMQIDDEWLVLHFPEDRVSSQNRQSD